ncbi:MAG: methyltransferase domain-containing protein [Rhodospirillaceae bacterium]|nr:methyltransferase domain-containing protein [Rhodospirillaceae bacterium]MBT5048659.1 methyltransferase domain-containing protein [Rhodospirillaceae bacterium]MBT5455022.1 methyltransferase domain-containing protein [Rhodospirillaceae bacterium]
MTYADWAGTDRLPKSDEDFQDIEKYVLRHSPWLRAWFAKAAFMSGKTCVDIGSGSGIFSSLLARNGARVTAVDLTAAGATMTSQAAGFFGVDVRPLRADLEKMPFDTGSFDFAWSWGVLHHTSQMKAGLGEMSRILRPGGAGMMMVYHRISIVYYLHGLFWLVFKGKLFRGHNFRTVQDFYTDGYYHRYLTAGELTDMLSAAGLRVTKTSVTQYEKKILPFIPAPLDRYLKARFGMCLIAEFKKPAGD